MNKLTSIAMFASLMLIASSQAVADEQNSVWAVATFDHTEIPVWTNNGTERESANTYGVGEDSESTVPFPLDLPLAGPWEEGYLLGDDYGLWAYADPTGRVRTSVKTGREFVEDPEFPPSKHALTELIWIGTFTRTATEIPKFTINPSWLELRAIEAGEGMLRDLEARKNSELPVVPPFSSIQFKIGVRTKDGARPVFTLNAKLSGIVRDILDPFVPVSAQTPIDVEIFEVSGGDYDPVTGESRIILDQDENPIFEFPGERIELRGQDPCVNHPDIEGEFCQVGAGVQIGLRQELGPYTGGLPLDLFGVEQGDRYTVVYEMTVEAGEDRNEQFAEAFLGDPLDADGDGLPDGLSLETLDEPYATPSQVCTAEPAPDRFINHGNGTVTDMRTSLMWQRCPLGTGLDENGTPDDLPDDRCISDASAEVDWQTALELADADGLAGYNDWRLPNLKALESLVLTECRLPAIDNLAFPDIPSWLFWSSTPTREAITASGWTVNFRTGKVTSNFRQLASYALLVRDSGEEPVKPRSALTVARTSIEESDSGETAQLAFTVQLSNAAISDVTVDYATLGSSALESQDYLPVAGTLTIPAGAKSGIVVVTVQGDDEPEPPETVSLRLTNASGNAYLGVATATGTIVDDEPVIAFDDVIQNERNFGSGTMDFVLRLSRPATSPVSVDYTTMDAGAIAGDDYVATSGTVTFASGEDEAIVPVPINGDLLPENDDVLLLELSNPVGAHLALGERQVRGEIVDDDTPTLVALNDTGITHCATGPGTGLSCPQPGFERQDGDTGRDVIETNQDDGVDGFSFTKLAADGTDLPFDARQWACVRDNVTGLVWETKSPIAGSLHDQDATYSWYDTSGVNDGGDAGMPNAGQCSGIASCDTQALIASTSAEPLCGFDDWRLPSVEELWSLANMNPYSNLVFRGIDGLYFPYTNSFASAYYWTGTPSAENGADAWVMHFETPEPGLRVTSKQNAAFVRLVRGGEPLN